MTALVRIIGGILLIAAAIVAGFVTIVVSEPHLHSASEQAVMIGGSALAVLLLATAAAMIGRAIRKSAPETLRK